MITALLALAQTAAPVLPPGVSQEFGTQVIAIERMLEAGEFDKASEKLEGMPTAEVAVSWDDSGVPADMKVSFLQARDMAFATWKMVAPGVKFDVKPSGSVNFKFSDTAAQSPNGMSLTFKRPEAEVLIGLTRGEAYKTITSVNNVHNDVARALGAYLGVGNSPFASSVMLPKPAETQRSRLMPQDASVAIENLKVLDALRAAAAQKVKITPTHSKAVIGDSHDLGKMLHGEMRSFKIDVRNDGNGPLKMWLKPECGCTSLVGAQTVAPNSTTPIEVMFDTKEFDGDIVKGITFVTNDPVQPIREFKIRGNIRPMYRFLTPSGPVAILEENGASYDIFLTFKDVKPFHIKRADLLGIPGEVTVSIWKGEMADPQRGEGVLPRAGYKMTVLIPNRIPPGRSPGTLVVQTDSPIAPRVQFTVQAQKGIVALPDELYLGEVSEAKTSRLLVSRPGRPFNITGVESKSASFKVEVKKISADEYALEIAYDGKAPKGDLASSLVVTTDDPKQPVVTIPIVGTAR